MYRNTRTFAHLHEMRTSAKDQISGKTNSIQHFSRNHDSLAASPRTHTDTHTGNVHLVREHEHTHTHTYTHSAAIQRQWVPVYGKHRSFSSTFKMDIVADFIASYLTTVESWKALPIRTSIVLQYVLNITKNLWFCNQFFCTFLVVLSPEKTKKNFEKKIHCSKLLSDAVKWSSIYLFYLFW